MLKVKVNDIDLEVERLSRLGATVLTPAGDPSHLGFVAVILADPEGGEFCVVGRPEHQPSQLIYFRRRAELLEVMRRGLRS
mgnify:CR=1 FL=1